MRKIINKKKLVIVIATLFLAVAVISPIVSGTFFEKSTTTDYKEIFTKKLTLTENGYEFVENVEKFGTPPSNWDEINDNIKEKQQEDISNFIENSNDPNTINAIDLSDSGQDDFQVSSLGDFYVKWEITNPWGYAWTDISNNGKFAHMSKATGEGDANAPNSIVGPGYAKAGIYTFEQGQGVRWEDENTNGIVALKSPSRITGNIGNWGQGASATVYMLIEDWYNGDKVDTYSDTIYSASGYGNVDFNDALENVGVEFPLKTNHIYVIKTHATAYAQCGSTPDHISYTDIDSIKFKKVWFAYEEESQDYEISLREPQRGALYLMGRRINFPAPFSFAIVLGYVNAEAYDGGSGVSKVTFVAGSTRETDTSSSGGYFSARLDASRGIHSVYAIAYDSSGNEVATSSSVRSFFLI